MNFRIKVDVPKAPFTIKRSDAILSLGSCFSQRIGERLKALKFNIEVEPFGVLYDPISIANGLKIIAERKIFSAVDLSEIDGLFFSFAHSTLFSARNEKHALERINERIEGANQKLVGAPIVMLTLGTAWAFRHKANDSIVANCHKLPAELFKRELLSVEEIVGALQSAMSAVRNVAPIARFVFTVSPVRHVRDGLINDQLGKSVLFVALNELRKADPDIHYFPAFEILQHELRDHRFYAEDMAHPSDQATKYIWQQFENSMVDSAEQLLSKEINALRVAMEHKPFDGGSKEHQVFLKAQIEKLEKIGSDRPELDLSELRDYFTASLD